MVHNLRNRAVNPFSAGTAATTPAPPPDLPPTGTTRSRRAQGTRPGTFSRAPPGPSTSTDKDRSASPFDRSATQIPFDHAVQRLRDRRDTALLRRYDANAAFWGEQVLALTGATIDAHALALAYLNQGQPGRALAALGHGSALLNSAAVDVAQAARVSATATTDHVRVSLACRIVAVQALLAMDRLEDALGYADPAQFDTVPVLDPVPLARGETQRRAVLFALEAAARIRQNGNMLLAKECLLKALDVDITAYDAFRALTEFKLFTPDEERDWMLKSLFGVPPSGIAAIAAAHAVTPGPLTALYHPPANVDTHLCALYAAHLSPPTLHLAATLIPTPTTSPRPTTAIDALQTLAQPDLVCTPLIHHRCAELTLAAGSATYARSLLDALLLRDPYHPAVQTTHLALLRDQGHVVDLFQYAHTLAQAAGWAVHDAIDPNARRTLPRTAGGPLNVPGSAGTGSGSRLGIPSVHGVHPSALAAFAIACYYAAAGRTEDAVEQYLRAIDVCDMYVAAYLGVARTVEGKVDKAKYLRVMDVLQAARRVAPNSTEVVAALGRVAAAHGDWSLASAYFRKAREGGCADPGVVAELGWTYLEQHMYDDAARTLHEALALVHPHTTSAAARARIHAGLARACHAIEDRHRTLHHAHEALSLTPPGTPTWSQMHSLLASTYESTGDLASAISHLHRALDGDPTNAAVHDALDRVIKRRHEPQAAQPRVPKRAREPSSSGDEVPWAAGRIGMAGIAFPPPMGVDEDDMDTAEFDAARAAAREATGVAAGENEEEGGEGDAEAGAMIELPLISPDAAGAPRPPPPAEWDSLASPPPLGSAFRDFAGPVPVRSPPPPGPQWPPTDDEDGGDNAPTRPFALRRRDFHPHHPPPPPPMEVLGSPAVEDGSSTDDNGDGPPPTAAAAARSFMHRLATASLATATPRTPHVTTRARAAAAAAAAAAATSAAGTAALARAGPGPGWLARNRAVQPPSTPPPAAPTATVAAAGGGGPDGRMRTRSMTMSPARATGPPPGPVVPTTPRTRVPPRLLRSAVRTAASQRAASAAVASAAGAGAGWSGDEGGVEEEEEEEEDSMEL